MNKLIIFDCDGVLVDTEPLMAKAFAQMAAELGVQMTQAEAMRHFRGASMDTHLKKLSQMAGKPIPADLEPRLRQWWKEIFEAELQPIPGITEVLPQLHSWAKCVASNAPQAKMEHTLGLTGLLPHFTGRLFTAYQVGKWKPEPDLFLYCAQTLGFSPADCVVVEDSVPGIQAGYAAGMTVIGFTSGEPAETLTAAGATTILPHMSHLPTLLAELFS